MQAVRNALLLSLTVAFLGSTAGVARSSEVTIDVPGGVLHGTLLEPSGRATYNVALLVSGSGPTDRNGNAPGLRNDSLKLLAEGLLRHGIGSLRFDKRGAGESARTLVDENNIVIETYVGDVKRWLDYLVAKPNVSARYIIGHSEGALIGNLAALDAPIAAVVLIAGAGFPAADTLRTQLDNAPVATLIRSQAIAILEAILAGEEIGTVPAPLQPLFRPSVQPYLRSWFRYDPAVEIAKLRVPVLIVQGTTDIQIGVADAQRLSAANRRAQLLLIDGMNHILKAAPRSRLENLATYNDPSLPLARDLVEAIAVFLEPVARSR